MSISRQQAAQEVQQIQAKCIIENIAQDYRDRIVAEIKKYTRLVALLAHDIHETGKELESKKNNQERILSLLANVPGGMERHAAGLQQVKLKIEEYEARLATHYSQDAIFKNKIASLEIQLSALPPEVKRNEFRSAFFVPVVVLPKMDASTAREVYIPTIRSKK